MSFQFVEDEEYRIVCSHKDEKGLPRKEKRSRYPDSIHPKDWQTFFRFCVSNRHELGKPTCTDTLNDLKVIDGCEYNTITCKNRATGESFQIKVSYINMAYDVTIANYYHFAGFSTKEVVTKGHTYSDSVSDQMGFSVCDIFKYYYHLNKDSDNHGFDTSLNPTEVKAMWEVIKRGAEYYVADERYPCMPLGLGDNINVNSTQVRRTQIQLWNIKDRKTKWDDTNFFRGMVLMNVRHLKHPSSAQNLASLYVTGSNLQFDDPDLLVFDEPKSLVDVLTYNENTRNNDIKYILNQLTKRLKPEEEELLQSTYIPFTLKKGFFTTMDVTDKKDEFTFIEMELSKRKPNVHTYLSKHDKECSKMMSYPLFAFRNIHVQDWIPSSVDLTAVSYYTQPMMESSFQILHSIVRDKVEEQKSEKMKLLKERKGGYIDTHSDRKYNYLTDSSKDDYCYSPSWEKANKKRQNNKRRTKVKKSASASDV